MRQLILAGAGAGAVERWWSLAAVLITCAIAGAYGYGVQGLWRRGGVGSVVSPARAASFAVAVVVLLYAVSPLGHQLARLSFTGHMIQQMLLLVVVGPLLAAGAAGLPLALTLPPRARLRWARWRASALGRWLRRPLHRALVVAGAQVAVMWAWHLPALYLAAHHDPAVRTLEHATFVATAWLLWSSVLAPSGRRLTGPVAFLLLFAAGMAAAALGAVLTLAPAPLYPGVTLADQQLAGLVMWVPMDVVDMLLALTLFFRWLKRMDRESPGGREVIAAAPAGEVTGP
ncbi:cytochrome c oxidase assembly protein [Amycolatopsis thermoflava]|uniref:cytochrome c oxidase assembly protein n=1 Tax=Amycolatopsis thermoflava TaxID=84480 RepID=UPI003EBDEF87